MKTDNKEEDEQLEILSKEFDSILFCCPKILVNKTRPEITTDLRAIKWAFVKKMLCLISGENMVSLFLGLGLVNLKFSNLDF